MATISTMAIRVITQHAEAIGGLVALGTAVTGLATEVVRANGAVQATAAAQEAAARAYSATTGEVTKFAGKLLGVATVAAATSKAIRMSATDEMRSSYERLSTAVEAAFKAFGDGFDRAAGLHQIMDALTAVVRASIGALNVLGTVLGTVVGWVAACAPLAIALAIAFKIVATAAVILAHVIITRLVVAFVTELLLGQALKPTMLALTVAKYALALACGVLTAAVSVLSTALGILMAVGFPVWVAIAIIVGVVLIAITAVVAIVWGLIYAWRQWVSEDDKNKKIEELDKLQSKMRELSQSAGATVDEVQKKIDQFGMSDMEKSIDDFIRKNAELRQLEGETAFAESVAVYQQALEKLEAMEASAKRQKELEEEGLKRNKERYEAGEKAAKMRLDLDTKLAQVGMTEQQKELAAFAALIDKWGMLDAAQRAAAIADFKAQQDKVSAAEKELEIKKMIADLQQEAAQAGMTEAQKKIADLQAAGATAEQIAAAQKALAQKEAADEKSRLMERGKQLKDSLATPAEEYKKKMNEIGRLLAQKAIDPITAMRAADAAGKALEDASMAAGAGRNIASPAALLKGSAEAALAEDRQKTPFEKMTDLQRKQLAENVKLNKTAKDMLAEQIKGGKVVNIP